VRERGYAIDEEEIELGLKCVAAPVRNAADEVVAAISLSGPKFRLDGDEMKRIVRLVLAAASRVSAAMCDDAAHTPEPRRRLRLARNGPVGE
jgi:DNA-binding IclR family transcriptional regulator